MKRRFLPTRRTINQQSSNANDIQPAITSREPTVHPQRSNSSRSDQSSATSTYPQQSSSTCVSSSSSSIVVASEEQLLQPQNPSQQSSHQFSSTNVSSISHHQSSHHQSSHHQSSHHQSSHHQSSHHQSPRRSKRKRILSIKAREDATNEIQSPNNKPSSSSRTHELSQSVSPSIEKIFHFFGKQYDDKYPSVSTVRDGENASIDNWRWRNLSTTVMNFFNTIVHSITSNNVARQVLYAGIYIIIGKQHKQKDDIVGMPIEKLDDFALMYKMAPNGSKEHDMLLSVLTSFSNDTLKLLDKRHDLNLSNSHLMKTKGSRIRQELKEKGVIKKKSRQVCRISREVLVKVVKFLLSDDNCVKISWGTKKVKLKNGQIINNFPRLMRKKTRKLLWKEYFHITDNTATKIRVGRTLFYEVCNALTDRDPRILSAIDYVSTKLINENIEMMQEVIQKMIPRGAKRKEIEKMLALSRHFLKNQYKSFVASNDSYVCFHGLDYALNPKGNHRCRRNTDCSACKFPFYVCSLLIEELKKNQSNKPQEMVNDAVDIIKEGKRKFLLFMKHQCRVKCQQTATDKVLEELRRHCIATDGTIIRAHVIMDFKMKFEPRSQRESTQEHFGKRGIGWHGILVIFYKMVDVLHPDGSVSRVPRRFNIYIDQLIAEGTSQDSLTVIGLLDAALAAIRVELPFIKEISLQSDNAGCYQGGMILLGILFLNRMYQGKIRISEFLHSETQDGKCEIDGHFSQAGSFIDTYLKHYLTNKTKKILTARDLGGALSSNGGMNNAMVQLIDVRRGFLLNMKTKAKKMVDKIKGFFSRVNHVYFPEDDVAVRDVAIIDADEPHSVTTSVMFDQLIGKFYVQSYSGIGRKVQFFLDMSQNKFECDNEAKRSIDEWLVTHSTNSRLRNSVADSSSDSDDNDYEGDESSDISGSSDDEMSRHSGESEDEEHDGDAFDDDEELDEDCFQDEVDLLEALEDEDDLYVLNDDGSVDTSLDDFFEEEDLFVNDSDSMDSDDDSYVLKDNGSVDTSLDGDFFEEEESLVNDDCNTDSSDDLYVSNDDDDCGSDDDSLGENPFDDADEYDLAEANLYDNADDSTEGDDDESYDDLDDLEEEDSDDDSQDEDDVNISLFDPEANELEVPSDPSYVTMSSGIKIEGVKGLRELVQLKKIEDTAKPNQAPTQPIHQEILCKDALSRCVLIALNEATSEGSLQVTAADQQHPSFEKAKDHAVDSVQPGWARRLRGESLYGETYMTDTYRTKIEELFAVGVADKSQKKSPGEMREIIQQENPLELKIPAESAIRQLVSMLAQKQKSDNQEDNVDGDDDDNLGSRRKRWDKLCDADNKLLEDVVNENPTMMPEAAYNEWRTRMTQKYGGTFPQNNIPEKKVIKSRLSQLKSKLKKRAMYSVVAGS